MFFNGKMLTANGNFTTTMQCILGSGEPTAETLGAVGCMYMDSYNGDLYKCTAENDGLLTWEFIGNRFSAILIGGKEDVGREIEISAGLPELSETGHPLYGRLVFYCTDDDQQTQLCNIADGTEDNHAATVGQMNTAVDTRISKTLLWENASPSSVFGAQTLNISLVGYDELEVEFLVYGKSTASFGDLRKKITIPIEGTVIGGGYAGGEAYTFINTTTICQRGFVVKSMNSLQFLAATNVGSSITSVTNYMTPMKIYGIKGVQ